MAAWLYIPQEPGALAAGGHMCYLQDNIKQEVLPMIFCSAGISAGLVYLLIGNNTMVIIEYIHIL